MRWPEIFFKAKPGPSPHPAGSPVMSGPLAQDQASEEVTNSPSAPAAPPVSQADLPSVPVHPGAPDDSVIREMEEADTLRTMTRSGGVRLVKLTAPIPPVANEPAAPANSNGWAKLDEPAATPDLTIPRETPPGTGEHPPEVTFLRRRTKIADVARIVLPPRRDEVAPPAAKAGAELKSTGALPPQPLPAEPAAKSKAASATETLPTGAPKPPASFPAGKETEDPARKSAPVPATEWKNSAARSTYGVGQSSGPLREETPPLVPKPVIPGSAGPESVIPAAPPSQMDPPAPRREAALAETREKREFVLSNGERILGHILSETPDTIYVDHSTLGVLTIPRAQVAQRPIEVILINGDRIVGDVVAETSDALFVRHASLGILTVPHQQRSTRVVEAILKDGDRILGEVLGETENFTVIRSATLGTVSVPHHRVAMLNKRAEEIQMKSLPPTTPQVEDKPSA